MKKIVLLMAVCVLFGAINTVEAKVIKQPNATYSNKIEANLGKFNDGLIKQRDKTKKPNITSGVPMGKIKENYDKNNKKIGNVTEKARKNTDKNKGITNKYTNLNTEKNKTVTDKFTNKNTEKKNKKIDTTNKLNSVTKKTDKKIDKRLR